MIYLLAKYTLLFLLALVLGVLLGRWWIRRSYVDVSDSYPDLEEAQNSNERAWDRLWKRLDMLDGGIEPKISQAFAAQPQQTFPSVDLSGIERRLAGLERRLEQAKPPAQPDFGPVITRLEQLEKAVTAASAASDAARRSAPAEAGQRFDLSPVSERIADLERYVRTLPRTSHQLDLSPIKFRLGAIESAIETLGYSAVSATPTGERTTSSSLDGASSALSLSTASANTAVGAEQQNSGPQLFDSASAGERDDLKKISGIGPKLESLLNQNGVYYFWQIASWTDADIAFIDERLDVFKGRIHRDKWVEQSLTFKALPGAAQAPK